MEAIEEYDVNSHELRQFLTNKRELAFAYLMTVGAKALVVCNERIRDAVLKDGMDDESKASKIISLNEVIREQQSKLRDGVGVEVVKRGRGGETTRKLRIKIKAKANESEEYLVWSAHWTGARKKFTLHTLTNVEMLFVRKPVTAGSNAGGDGAPPYIRLTNPERYVDIKFNTMQESEAFVSYCQGLIKPAQQSCNNIRNYDADEKSILDS